MTQLNLSGKQSTDTPQKSSTDLESGSIKNQTVGALGALAMFAAVIVIGSCSRSSKPVAVEQPTQPVAPVSAPAVTAPASVTAPAVAKTKAKKRRAATLSYVNREYGVSFSFPKQYSLKSGDQAQLSWGDLGPFQMDFVQPGGVTLAAVELPDNSYPGTDFKSAFVNVSVHPGMTSETCTQFAFPEPSAVADPAAKTEPGKVKIGAIEYSEVEHSSAAMLKQTDARYYHAFRNGTCYEFALGLGTEGDGAVDGITPVDREEVFGKLAKVLSTVKIQPSALPETEAPAPTAAIAVPADSSKGIESGVSDRDF